MLRTTSRKGFANLAVAIFAVAIIAAVFGYFGLTQRPAPPPQGITPIVFVTEEECERVTGRQCGFQMCDYVPLGKTFEEICGKNFRKGWVPTVAPDPTTDWKTYRNEEYGFEFRYPNTYSQYPTDEENVILLTTQGETQVWDIRIAYLVQDTDKQSVYDLGLGNVEYIKINSIDALKLLQDVPSSNPIEYGYILIHNGKEYILDAIARDSKTSNDAEQILSTFKFIE